MLSSNTQVNRVLSAMLTGPVGIVAMLSMWSPSLVFVLDSAWGPRQIGDCFHKHGRPCFNVPTTHGFLNVLLTKEGLGK
jgi:hypothetical protein